IKGILNYEKIRSTSKEIKGKTTLEENEILQYITEKNIQFDFILCDEAHKLRNSNTQTYKGASLILSHAIAAVFLTATPIMISEDNLYNLLHLLDEHQFNNKDIFKSFLEMNRPFIKAISQINSNVPFKDILNELESAEIILSFENEGLKTIDEFFSEIPLYQSIIEKLNSDDTKHKRVDLQRDISALSLMNNIFSRTRKRDVVTDESRVIRNPHQPMR